MAEMISRSNKAAHVLGILYLMLLVQKAAAFEFIVGGTKGWSVPSDTSTNSFNQWAEKNRFQIGDSLVFNYSGDQDSVLYVNSDDYDHCNTASPLEKYTDGHAVIKFSHSGAHHYISGNKDNCLKNEKLLVVVLADRSKRSYSNTNQTSPSPSPAPPAGESPPPPEGTVEINPTPAPVSEPSPPPNGASSILVGLAGSIGVFLASSFVLVF